MCFSYAFIKAPSVWRINFLWKVKYRKKILLVMGINKNKDIYIRKNSTVFTLVCVSQTRFTYKVKSLWRYSLVIIFLEKSVPTEWDITLFVDKNDLLHINNLTNWSNVLGKKPKHNGAPGQKLLFSVDWLTAMVI